MQEEIIDIIKSALKEDMPKGDVTTDSLMGTSLMLSLLLKKVELFQDLRLQKKFLSK